MQKMLKGCWIGQASVISPTNESLGVQHSGGDAAADVMFVSTLDSTSRKKLAILLKAEGPIL